MIPYSRILLALLAVAGLVVIRTAECCWSHSMSPVGFLAPSGI